MNIKALARLTSGGNFCHFEMTCLGIRAGCLKHGWDAFLNFMKIKYEPGFTDDICGTKNMFLAYALCEARARSYFIQMYSKAY